jgi:hypothetical protein
VSWTNFPRTGSLYSLIKIVDSDLKNRIIYEKIHRPKAYIQITDEDSNNTLLGTANSFNISLDNATFLDRFTVNVDRASVWNPRGSGYRDLLRPDRRKRIGIYFGQEFSDEITYEKIFTGIPESIPESYKYGTSNTISISGNGLGYLLSTQDGDYANDRDENEFTGTSQELIEYWCAQAGITNILSYEDPISFTEEQINWFTSMTGMVVLVDVLGPKIDYFFTPQGVMVLRDTPDAVEDDIEFAYTESNILRLKMETENSDVITVADVQGNTDDASATGEASDLYIDKFGRNKQTISSTLIVTSTEANKLVEDILVVGRKREFHFEFDVPLNPYIWSGSLLSVEDDDLSDTEVTMVRAKTVDHQFRTGSTQITKVTGYKG